jgi:hypothetical protein
MSQLMATTEVRIAWWLKPYFYMLALICAFTGREPNYERVQYWIRKAVTKKARK